jgi:hypothetical protein
MQTVSFEDKEISFLENVFVGVTLVAIDPLPAQ